MRKEVDNFELLANKLFDKQNPLPEDEFYFVQILVRGKDGHHVSGNNKNRLVKYYTVSSKEQLLSLKEEITGIAKAVTGRVYIHPTKRSYKEVANVALELTTHTYVSQNWIGMRSVFSTAAGKSMIAGDKKYIVDLDDITFETTEGIKKYQQIVSDINNLRGKSNEQGNKIYTGVPTKSGIHLITYPFDVDAFKKLYPDIDVHKNNPTLLYFSWEE